MHAFQPGDRVSFRTVAGEMLGTVETLHEDDVCTVRPDDGAELEDDSHLF